MNHLTALILVLFLSLNSFGQTETDTLADDIEYIEIYIDKGGAFYLDGWRKTMTEFDEYLATTELKHAKLATLFPTPMFYLMRLKLQSKNSKKTCFLTTS